jgi:hypothetical protein
MFVLTTVNLKYKGRLDDSEVIRCVGRVLQACFIMAVKFSGIAAIHLYKGKLSHSQLRHTDAVV